MGSVSRQKGATFERYVANKLKALYPNARRRGGDQAGTHRLTAPDVDGTPFWIECKVGRSFTIKGAFEQAEEARALAGDTRPILVCTRAHGCPQALVWANKATIDGQSVTIDPWALLLEDYVVR